MGDEFVEDDNFKLYYDEESRKLKSDMKMIMGNIDSLVKKFLKNFHSNKKLQGEMNKMIYENELFNSKSKLENFTKIVKASKDAIDHELIEKNKANAEMKKKRVEEIDKVKSFVETTYLKALPGAETYLSKGNLKALPMKVQEIDVLELDEGLEEDNANVLFKPKAGKFDDSEEEREIEAEKIEKAKIDPKQFSIYGKSKYNVNNTHSLNTNLNIKHDDIEIGNDNVLGSKKNIEHNNNRGNNNETGNKKQ